MYICLLYIHIGAICVEIPFLCACLWDKEHDRDVLLRNVFSDMYLGIGDHQLSDRLWVLPVTG